MRPQLLAGVVTDVDVVVRVLVVADVSVAIGALL